MPLPIDGDDLAGDAALAQPQLGHPVLVRSIERSREDARKAGWPGLLVGDMSQPRGGPMKTGHASHQIGLDADIWLTPMPTATLSREEREEKSARWWSRPTATTSTDRSGRRRISG